MLVFEEVAGGDKLLPPKPFLQHASKLYDVGIAPIPCDNKTPLVSWKKYQGNVISSNFAKELDEWCKKFPASNIGIVTGSTSNLTVIDCDNPSLSIEDLETEFGASNFIVSTPRGGKHLYYKYNGEATGIVREKIDIKAKGGLIIAPYSFSAEKKEFYKIVKGNLVNLSNLTSLKIILPLAVNKNVDIASQINESDLKIEEGRRNKYLFDKLRKITNWYQSKDELEKAAFDINYFSFEKPLEAKEVINVVNSVWKYKITGNLITGNKGGAFIAFEEAEKLKNRPRAIYLLWFLKYYHSGVTETFCIDQVKTAEKIGWNKKTLIQAIDALIKSGFLIRLKNNKKKTYKDGKIKTSPYKYKLCCG